MSPGSRRAAPRRRLMLRGRFPSLKSDLARDDLLQGGRADGQGWAPGIRTRRAPASRSRGSAGTHQGRPHPRRVYSVPRLRGASRTTQRSVGGRARSGYRLLANGRDGTVRSLHGVVFYASKNGGGRGGTMPDRQGCRVWLFSDPRIPHPRFAGQFAAPSRAGPRPPGGPSRRGARSGGGAGGRAAPGLFS